MKSLLAAMLIAVMLLAAAPAGAADQPVLGSPDYVMNGSGWGTVAPTGVSNGGSPGGVMSNIRWKNWGAPTATGTGEVHINPPQGNYYPPIRVPVKVTKIGTCPGSDRPAYLELWLRSPQWPGGPLGTWWKWSGGDVCHYGDTDPAYASSRWPGRCGNVGEYGDPGAVQSIDVYRLSCSRARSVAGLIRSEPKYSQQRACVTAAGCKVRIRGMHCQLSARPEERDYNGAQEQRVACTRGNANFSAWHVLPGAG